MPTNAPSNILLSNAKLSTPAWLQSSPPNAARRIGVARRMLLFSNSTVKTLKNPSMGFLFSFYVATAPAVEPISKAGDILLVQSARSDEEDNKSDDRTTQFARNIQL